MRKVVALDPEDANALNYLGYTYADLGIKLDEAETLVEKAMEFKSDDGYITDSLGWVYYQQGRYEEAVEVLEKAVELVSDDSIILEHMGDAYLKVGRKKDALAFYRKALDRKQEDLEEEGPGHADGEKSAADKKAEEEMAKLIEKIQALESELEKEKPAK
jgi:Flp pilus assembly protein TadD